MDAVPGRRATTPLPDLRPRRTSRYGSACNTSLSTPGLNPMRLNDHPILVPHTATRSSRIPNPVMRMIDAPSTTRRCLTG